MIYKKEFKGKKVFVKGYGQIDTDKITAETIKKLSLNAKYRNLAKLIENEKKAEPKGKDK